MWEGVADDDMGQTPARSAAASSPRTTERNFYVAASHAQGALVKEPRRNSRGRRAGRTIACVLVAALPPVAAVPVTDAIQIDSIWLTLLANIIPNDLPAVQVSEANRHRHHQAVFAVAVTPPRPQGHPGALRDPWGTPGPTSAARSGLEGKTIFRD